MRRSFIIFLFVLVGLATSLPLLAQQAEPTIARLTVHNGDTMPLINLPEVWIWGPIEFKNKSEERKYNRLIRNVKRVYPYAKLAGKMLRDYEEILIAAESDAERRRIMRRAEAELKEEYSDELKRLTFSQGHILIKLVDRETGNSTYSLLEELRGKFLAFFWQNFARLFGYNLKDKYDPTGRDKDIENIVLMIESGVL
jgi:hypothetical protein